MNSEINLNNRIITPKFRSRLRYIYAAFLLAILLLVINPVGLPIKISPVTQAYYDAITTVPKGAVILFESYVDLAVWNELGPVVVVTFKTVWSIPEESDVTIILYQNSTDGVSKVHELLKGECKPSPWRQNSYGMTWVDLGLIKDLDKNRMRLMASDFVTVVSTDYYGTSISSIPAIQKAAANAPPYDVLNAYDINLFIWGSWGSSTVIDSYVRLWWLAGSPPYKVPMLVMSDCESGCFQPYYGPDKPLKSYLSGSSGAAELELLTGFKGEGIKATDIKAVVGIGTLVLVVLGNRSLLRKYLTSYKQRKVVR